MKQIYLYPGQWVYSKEPAEISTILGSCVGVALYDYKLRTGGLNHYLLPNVLGNEVPSPRYGSFAISTLIQTMYNNGSEKKSIQAKIFGGASVLSGVTIGDGIGHRNIEIAKKLLDENRIPIVEENVGGLRGRRICLNTETFEVVHKLQGDEKGPVDITGFGLIELKKTIRVVIVDDSATVRSLFQKIFTKLGIEVVGTAANAYEARDIIVKTKPDVITLDLEMPKMNGVVFLEKLMKHMPIPVVVVSSLGSQGAAALRTLELGAIEFIHKPSQFDPILLKQLGEMLVEKIKAAASVDVIKESRKRNAVVSEKKDKVPLTSSSLLTVSQAELKALVIGGNAGSTESLRLLLEDLPADTPPVVVANCTIVPFLENYLEKLRRRVKLTLCVAKHGDILKMGNVYFAPQDSQTRIVQTGAGLSVDIKNEAPVCGQQPSSTVLFQSAATAVGAGTIAILLGGFGSDGVEGLQKIKASGGVTYVEDPSLAAFPYAPQKAIELGIADQVLNASQMSEAITDLRNRRVAA
ncbi:MAG: chemotaxis protein CheB [Bdellovibrionota bacterium]